MREWPDDPYVWVFLVGDPLAATPACCEDHCYDYDILVKWAILEFYLAWCNLNIKQWRPTIFPKNFTKTYKGSTRT